MAVYHIQKFGLILCDCGLIITGRYLPWSAGQSISWLTSRRSPTSSRTLRRERSKCSHRWLTQTSRDATRGSPIDFPVSNYTIAFPISKYKSTWKYNDKLFRKRLMAYCEVLDLTAMFAKLFILLLFYILQVMIYVISVLYCQFISSMFRGLCKP